MTRSHIQLPPDGSGKAALAFAETETGTPAPNGGVRYIQAFVPVDQAGDPLPSGASEATLAAVLTELGQKLEPADLTALATAAKQDSLKTSVDAVTAKLSGDPATQATLAAVLTELGQKLEPGDLAALSTAAKQDAGNTTLASILAKLSNDPATQATLAAVLAKLSSDPATGAKQDAAQTRLNLLATEGTLSTLSDRIGTTATAGSVAALLDAIHTTQTGQSVDPSDRAGRLLGHVTVDNLPATQPISGTVAVSNFPATQAVSVASLPLPTGAATAAAQATLNAKDFATETTLSSINTLLATPTGLPVDIQDASLAVTGPIGVTDNGGSLTVDGSVSVSNFPATQAVSAASLPLPSGAATSAKQDTQTTLLGGGLPTALVGGRLDVNVGAMPSLPAGANAIGSVSVSNFPATQAVTGPLTDAQLRATAVPVSGTFWQATQPVSGPLTDTQLRATAVPVSGPLTDTQLRATPVPVDTELSAAGPLALEATQSSVLTALQTAGGLAVNTELPTVTAAGGATAQANVQGTASLLFAGGGNYVPMFSASAVGGDNSSLGAGPAVADYDWNGASWDRHRNNLDGTALASAARTATTSSADITNYNGDGVMIVLRVSTVPGTAPSLVTTIEAKDPVSGTYYALNANPTAVTAVGTYVYEIGEGASGAAGGGVTQRTAGQVPRVFRATVTHGNANSVTYSVGYSIITA